MIVAYENALGRHSKYFPDDGIRAEKFVKKLQKLHKEYVSVEETIFLRIPKDVQKQILDSGFKKAFLKVEFIK